MSVLPTNDKERKNLPIFTMIARYFPKALREVTRVCVANNVRYNPDRKPADINWARGKSTDQLGSLFRHMLEYEVDGLIFEELPPEVQAACGPGFERVYVLAEAAWRALAALELCIEKQETGQEERVKALVAATEAERGPLSPEQVQYATRAATAYVAREAALAIHSPGATKPEIGCECPTCDKLRKRAQLGV